MPDYRWRHDVADAVRILRGHHGHAGNVPVDNGRATAVARVDRGIDLHGEQIQSAVHIVLMLDARYDAPGDTHGVAPQGKPVDGHLLLDGRKIPEFQGGGTGKEVGIIDTQQRKVGIMRDALHACIVSPRLAIAANLYERAVADHMGVGQHLPSFDDAARPGT